MHLESRRSYLQNKIILALVILFLNTGISVSEEGMWTFFSLPLEQLKEKYNFNPDKEWIDHVRLSTVQIDGGSGAFVSPDGLIMTNHHVVVGTAGQIKGLDFIDKGYLADGTDNEVKLPGLSASILISMKNVTSEIESSYDKSMPDDTIEAKINNKKNEISQAANKENKLLNRVLYFNNTAEYWLYSFKVLSDIRLVFAPEASVAAFGGYFNDNFTFPRYNLDVSFVRAYENGAPYKSKDYFRWNTKGAAESELVFIPGNPGHTNRFITSPEFNFLRDCHEKKSYILSKYFYEYALEMDFEGFSNNLILQITNRHKINSGMVYGMDQQRNAKKIENLHQTVVGKLKGNQPLLNEYINSYNIIDSLASELCSAYRHRIFVLKDIDLYQQAQILYRLAYELDTNRELTTKEETIRNKGIIKIEDTTIINKENQLYALTKYFNSIKKEGMADELKFFEITGFDNPDTAARELCETKLYDRDFRVKLMMGGAEALEACNDPFIRFVIKVEKSCSKYNDEFIQEIWSGSEKQSIIIAKAYNAVFGNDITPDANFTPRFSFGTVKGYFINGYNIPWKTTIYGLFDKSASNGNKGDYFLPKRVWEAAGDLNMSTPCNYVTTNDIIGGNSGSSVINKKAEVVGIVFDGNFESIIGQYVFDDDYARAVCVHPAFIIEALRKIYDAGSLADEVEGK